MTNLMASLLYKYGLAERLTALKNMVENRVGAFYTDCEEIIFDADGWR